MSGEKDGAVDIWEGTAGEHRRLARRPGVLASLDCLAHEEARLTANVVDLRRDEQRWAGTGPHDAASGDRPASPPCSSSASALSSCAENEERSPWDPFHVQHGFRPSDSAVSVFSGCRSTAFTLGLRERHWRDHVRNLLRGLDPHNPPTFLLDPITARLFVERGGFATKEKLVAWVHDQARLPASEYWDYQLIQNYVYPRATFGKEPYASLLRAAPAEPIPMFGRDAIHVVVVGGETIGYWRIMGCGYGKTVSVDAWR